MNKTKVSKKKLEKYLQVSKKVKKIQFDKKLQKYLLVVKNINCEFNYYQTLSMYHYLIS